MKKKWTVLIVVLGICAFLTLCTAMSLAALKKALEERDAKKEECAGEEDPPLGETT